MMSKLEKYPKYKESGVEWLGEIPEEWEVNKLKYRAYIQTGNSISDHKKNNYENNDVDSYPYIATKDIEINYSKINYNNGLNIPKKEQEFKVSCVGSTLICIEGGSAGRKIAYNDRNICFVNKLASISSKMHNDSKFMYYLIKSNVFKEQFILSLNGLIGGVSVSVMKNFNLPYPSISEQTKISNYLEKKTAQINKAISLKEQMIEQLKERRQILINDAVTKGLDKTVKMKDSGVEWLGKVPEHWEVLPGFRVYKENKTKNIGMLEDQVLSLSYGKIIIKAKEKLTGLVPESFETYQIVKPGDIIIRCMDLQNDQTSLRTGIARNDGIITSAYLNLNVIEHFNSEYLHYYLHMLDITKVLYKFGTGLRQNLSYWDFKRLPVLVPSIKEQEKIVKFIETQTRKIDTTILLQQNQMERLKEYKATLIDSLVTGKAKIV